MLDVAETVHTHAVYGQRTPRPRTEDYNHRDWTPDQPFSRRMPDIVYSVEHAAWFVVAFAEADNGQLCYERRVAVVMHVV